MYSDPFSSLGSMKQGMSQSSGQFNPYANDNASAAAPGGGYYPGAGGLTPGPSHPPNYHLYAPTVPAKKPDLQPYQRSTYDFFMPADLRLDFHKKAFATLQQMPSKCAGDSSQPRTNLSAQTDHYPMSKPTIHYSP